MLRTIKRDGLVAKLSLIQYGDNNCVVDGEVYPFAKRFHSARVRVERGSRLGSEGDEVKYSAGFGGNTYEGLQFDLMLKAGQMAADLGKYYAARMEGLLDPSTALSAIENAYQDQDFEGLFETVFMLPLRNDDRFKIKESMIRNLVPCSMTAVDLLMAFPESKHLMQTLKAAGQGDENAWDSPEVNILKMVFSAAQCWDNLSNELGEDPTFDHRANVMLEAIERAGVEVLECGLLTTLRKLYGPQKT